MTSNRKPAKGKAPLYLIPFKPLCAIAAAFQHGDTKYGRGNWREPMEDWRDVYTGAFQRHVGAYSDPDEPDIDDESGVHHLALACACGMILLYHEAVDYVVPKPPK